MPDNLTPEESAERYYAEMEAARNDAERAYFHVRQHLAPAGKDTFRAGFERAFNLLWNRPSPPPIGDLEQCLQNVMGRLADLLSDDNFNNIEAMVLEAGVRYPPLLSAETECGHCDDAEICTNKYGICSRHAGQAHTETGEGQ